MEQVRQRDLLSGRSTLIPRRGPINNDRGIHLNSTDTACSAQRMRCDLKGDTAYGGMWQESRFCAPSPDRRRVAIRRSAGYSSIARSGFQPAAAAHGTRKLLQGSVRRIEGRRE